MTDVATEEGIGKSVTEIVSQDLEKEKYFRHKEQCQALETLLRLPLAEFGTVVTSEEDLLRTFLEECFSQPLSSNKYTFFQHVFLFYYRIYSDLSYSKAIYFSSIVLFTFGPLFFRYQPDLIKMMYSTLLQETSLLKSLKDELSNRLLVAESRKETNLREEILKQTGTMIEIVGKNFLAFLLPKSTSAYDILIKLTIYHIERIDLETDTMSPDTEESLFNIIGFLLPEEDIEQLYCDQIIDFLTNLRESISKNHQEISDFNRKYALNYNAYVPETEIEEGNTGDEPEIPNNALKPTKALEKPSVPRSMYEVRNGKKVVTEKEKKHRKYQAKNKARFGNHNRKKGASRKSNRGMF